MIRLGYLDEDKGNRNSFNRIFKNDFEIVMLDDNSKIATLDMVLDEIDKQQIDVLAVDFRLADSGWVPYNGDEVLRMIWEKRRYYPVFILTSYKNIALQKMDNVFLVNDKDNLANSEYVNMLKQQIICSVDAYHRIVEEKSERMLHLVKKQRNDRLDDAEEKELCRLNVELNAIDPKSNLLSPDLMLSKNVKRLHQMVDLTKELLNSIKN